MASWRGCASSFTQPMSEQDENAARELMNTIYRTNCEDTRGRPQLKDVIYRTGDRDRDILRHVFRWDLAPYQEVFQNGLRVNQSPSRGRDVDSVYSLIDYVEKPNATPLDSRQPSKFGFISTTISNSWLPPVVNTTELYRYEIYAPGGIWVAVSVGQHANNNTRFDEVAFPTAIAPHYIRAVQIFKLVPQPHSNTATKVERVKREVIINANFNPQSHPLKMLKLEDPVCDYVVEDNVRAPLRSTIHHPESPNDSDFPDRPESQDDSNFPGGPGGGGGGFPGGPGGCGGGFPGGRGGGFPGGPGGCGGGFPGGPDCWDEGPGGRGGRFQGGPGGRGGRFSGGPDCWDEGPGGRGGRFPGGPGGRGGRFSGGPDCWDEGPDCWDDGPDSSDDGPDSGDDRFPHSPDRHGDRFRGSPDRWGDRFPNKPGCWDDGRSPGRPRRASPPRSTYDSDTFNPQRALPNAPNKTNTSSPPLVTSITEWYKDGVIKVMSYVDAAFRTSTENNAYYFLKNVSILVDYAPGTGDDRFVEGPMYIVDMFPFLKGTPFAEHRIDCAFGSHDDNQAYIFSANLCALITYSTEEGNTNSKILKGPMPIAEMFTCLKGTVFENGIGTAIEGRRNDVILFKGDQCARMLYKIDELIDLGAVAGVFPSLNGHLLETEIDAAHASHVEAEGSYVYKGDRFAYFYFGPGPDKIGDEGQVYKIGSQAKAMSNLYHFNRGLDLIPSGLQSPAPV